jgi:hypothetical protein
MVSIKSAKVILLGKLSVTHSINGTLASVKAVKISKPLFTLPLYNCPKPGSIADIPAAISGFLGFI